jgi:dUTP diphosphatase
MPALRQNPPHLGHPRTEEPVAREKPSLKIKRVRPNAKLPKRATPGSTGFDLFACIEDKGTIKLVGTQPKLIPTGIAIEVPKGYDVQIRPRSGLSAKGVGVTFGTIDSDYRGEILITMYLFNPDGTFEIKHSDRIAQMVVSTIADLPIFEVDELTLTERGSGGHGSTGT